MTNWAFEVDQYNMQVRSAGAQYRFQVCSADVVCAVQEKVPGARGFSCFLPRLLSTPGIAR